MNVTQFDQQETLLLVVGSVLFIVGLVILVLSLKRDSEAKPSALKESRAPAGHLPESPVANRDLDAAQTKPISTEPLAPEKNGLHGCLMASVKHSTSLSGSWNHFSQTPDTLRIARPSSTPC